MSSIRLNNLSPQTPIGQLVNKVREAHSPAPLHQAAPEALKQDAVNLTLGASGGVLGFTAVNLAQRSFNQLQMGDFILPAATGALTGLLVNEITDNQALKIAIGATTGAVAGFALSRLGLASSSAIVTGAVAGGSGSLMSSLIPQK